MQTVVSKLSVTKALDTPVKLPKTASTNANINWDEQAVIELALTYLEAGKLTRVAAIVDLLIFGAREGKCSVGMPHIVLEQAFEVISREQIGDLWRVLESRKTDLTAGLVGKKPPGTTLLRLANTIIRKSSPVRDSEFISQVELYLAEAFGPLEKTALNTVGKFRKDSLILVDDNVQDQKYRDFWELQRLASDPQSLLDPRKLELFLESAHNIEQQLPTISTVNLPSRFLNTDHDSLKLQLSGKESRTVLAVTVLTVVEMLLGQTEGAKRDQDDFANKSLIHDLKITEQQAEALKQMKSSWFKQLYGVHSSSELVQIREVFRSDKQWVLWKARNCPDFREIARTELLSDVVPVSPAPVIVPDGPALGGQYLTDLWAIETGLESYKASDKDVSRRSPQGIFDMMEKIEEPELWSTYNLLGFRSSAAAGDWVELDATNAIDGFPGLFGVTKRRKTPLAEPEPEPEPELDGVEDAQATQGQEEEPRDSPYNSEGSDAGEAHEDDETHSDTAAGNVDDASEGAAQSRQPTDDIEGSEEPPDKRQRISMD